MVALAPAEPLPEDLQRSRMRQLGQIPLAELGWTRATLEALIIDNCPVLHLHPQVSCMLVITGAARSEEMAILAQ
jgi:hypothetical protein